MTYFGYAGAGIEQTFGGVASEGGIGLFEPALQFSLFLIKNLFAIHKKLGDEEHDFAISGAKQGLLAFLFVVGGLRDVEKLKDGLYGLIEFLAYGFKGCIGNARTNNAQTL